MSPSEVRRQERSVLRLLFLLHLFLFLTFLFTSFFPCSRPYWPATVSQLTKF
jgi:hypothetical protein